MVFMPVFLYDKDKKELVPAAGIQSGDIVFRGTISEWNALTAEEQTAYSMRCHPDIDTGYVVDAVADGDLRAVSSNAVYDAINVIQSGTGARNTSYVSSENFICNWYKVGKICTVNIQYTLSQLTPSSVEIITELPKPVADIACVGEGNTNTNVSDFVIKKNGAVRTHYDGASGQFMHGTATYITTD